MPDQQTSQRFEVIVIGGGQAGLAAGNELTRLGLRFVILDANVRVGDAWRHRWDSLRLFTPARYSALPGMAHAGSPHALPSKDDIADYLEAYAQRKGLPVLNGHAVDELAPADDGAGYVVRAGDRWLHGDQVVVATGAYHDPVIPDFAGQLDAAIRQLHSRDYRRPAQLRDGRVLIVGGSNSGAEIALDVVGSHRTLLAGRNPGEFPIHPESRWAPLVDPVLIFATKHILTRANPMARRTMGELLEHGTPVERATLKRQRAAGVERTFARAVGVRDGLPLLDDGTVVEVANVIWATGFRPDFRWIRLPVTDPAGWPLQVRGVVASAPGLYFLGLPFMYSLSSALITGVGLDAAHLAKRIAQRAGAANGRRAAVAEATRA